MIRFLAAIVLVTALFGCATWKPTRIASRAHDLPDPIRVTLADGRQVELARPHAEGDSLRGLGRKGVPVAIALADVKRVERLKTDPGVVVVAILAILTIGFVALARWEVM